MTRFSIILLLCYTVNIVYICCMIFILIILISISTTLKFLLQFWTDSFIMCPKNCTFDFFIMYVLSVVYRTPRETSFADGAFLLKIKFIYLSILPKIYGYRDSVWDKVCSAVIQQVCHIDFLGVFIEGNIIVD